MANYVDETADIKQLQNIMLGDDVALKSAVTKLDTQLKTVADSVTTATNASKLTITDVTTTAGYLKTYTFTQGETEIGKIDIPKDFLVKSGSLVKNPEGKDEGTYIALVLNTQSGDETDSTVYIKVTDLVDVYEGFVGDEVTVKVEDYTISAEITKVAAEKVTYGEGNVKTALEGLEANKRDKTDNVAHADSEVFTDWTLDCPHPVGKAALDKGGWNLEFDSSNSSWLLGNVQLPEGEYISNDGISYGNASDIKVVWSNYFVDTTTGSYYPVTATREKLTVAKTDESYVTQSYVDTKSTEALTEAKAYADEVAGSLDGELAAVAKSGAAADVTITKPDTLTSTNVDTAIAEIAGKVDALEKGTYDDTEVRELIGENKARLDAIDAAITAIDELGEKNSCTIGTVFDVLGQVRTILTNVGTAADAPVKA
jgi:hypothetical protein